MSATENRKLVHDFLFQAFVERNLDAAEQLLSDDYVLYDPTRPDFGVGPEDFRTAHMVYQEAITDYHFKIDDQIAEGDKVVTRWTSTGTQMADLPGIPDKGKSYTIAGITITRVADGKIAEEWQVWDAWGMMRQLI